LGSTSSFIILLSIVAVLTLVLAAMAGYLLLIAGTPQTTAGTSNNSLQAIPHPDELSRKKLFEEKKYFNLKSDEGEISVIQVGVELVYFSKVKGIKNVEERITSYESQIKEALGTYFQQMTLEQVKDPGSKKKAKEDLKKQINTLLSSNEKNQYEIIYDIVFDEWFYQ
jgi:flagellar basal body-associated protein FliL